MCNKQHKMLSRKISHDLILWFGVSLVFVWLYQEVFKISNNLSGVNEIERERSLLVYVFKQITKKKQITKETHSPARQEKYKKNSRKLIVVTAMLAMVAAPALLFCMRPFRYDSKIFLPPS